MPSLDQFIIRFDTALRAIAGVALAARPSPSLHVENTLLDPAERRHSAGLMRVNHTGEICAQALYEAQARFADDAAMTRQFAQAAHEEEDHLAWTAERLRELGARPSWLNPVWYAGSYAIGVVAARAGNANSLGFVVETERQVEAHLNDHLASLPAHDAKSRAIVAQMRADEAAHGLAAKKLGAAELPAPVRQAMRAMSKLMTTVAYRL